MALAFTQDESDGTTATYFTLQQDSVYPNSECVDVVLYGYVSQAAFLAGKAPLAEATTATVRLTYSQLGITVTDPNNPPQPTDTQIYAALLTLPQWSGATLI